jgi:uncharacterized protein YodC (DUF2158 family)
MKFVVGQLVVKKTGGPAMMVVDDLNLTCQWIHGGSYREEEFQEADLMSLSDWIEVHYVEKKKRR